MEIPMNHELYVMEYAEGCGYNVRMSFDCGTEHFEIWASKTPFNRALMQKWIDRNIKETPGILVTQNMIYSKNFDVPLGNQKN